MGVKTLPRHIFWHNECSLKLSHRPDLKYWSHCPVMLISTASKGNWISLAKVLRNAPVGSSYILFRFWDEYYAQHNHKQQYHWAKPPECNLLTKERNPLFCKAERTAGCYIVQFAPAGFCYNQCLAHAFLWFPGNYICALSLDKCQYSRRYLWNLAI